MFKNNKPLKFFTVCDTLSFFYQSHDFLGYALKIDFRGLGGCINDISSIQSAFILANKIYCNILQEAGIPIP